MKTENESSWQEHCPSIGEVYHDFQAKWGPGAEVRSHASEERGGVDLYLTSGQSEMSQTVIFDRIGPEEVQTTARYGDNLAFHTIWERQNDGTFKLTNLEQGPQFPQFCTDLETYQLTQGQPEYII